jgi:hypothetical protein
MKLKITVDQLKKLLENQPPKFPITVIMKGIDQSELDMIGKLLRKKK